MAIAEPALRSFIRTKVRFRGGNLLGSALGFAISVGTSIANQYEITYPWNRMLQPRRGRYGQGVFVNGSQNGTQATAYQQRQTLR